jgi:hypothetical protein
VANQNAITVIDIEKALREWFNFVRQPSVLWCIIFLTW